MLCFKRNSKKICPILTRYNKNTIVTITTKKMDMDRFENNK